MMADGLILQFRHHDAGCRRLQGPAGVFPDDNASHSHKRAQLRSLVYEAEMK
jgi:hypothetical protein